MIATSELRKTWAGHTVVESLCDEVDAVTAERDAARARVVELEAVLKRVRENLPAFMSDTRRWLDAALSATPREDG